MTFEVCANAKKKGLMLFGQILCVVSIAGLLLLLNLDFMEATLQEDGLYLLFIGFIATFALILAFTTYAKRRPCIKVNGQSITIYALWRSAKQITLPEITSRTAKSDFSDLRRTTIAMRAAIPSIMFYTYYSGDTKLITVSTNMMENVELFDKIVRNHLEGNP